MSTPPLLPLAQLAEQFSMRPDRALSILTEAGIEPAGEWPSGRGKVRVYHSEPAAAALTRYRETEAQAKASRPAAAQADPAVLDEIRGLRAQVDALGNSIVEVEERNTEIAEAHRKLTEQNAILLRAFGDLRAVVLACVDEITHVAAKATTILNALDALKDGQATPTLALSQTPHHGPAEALPATTTPAPTMELKPAPDKGDDLKPKRIVLVGLTDAQFAGIEREFGKVLNLKHFTADASRNAAYSQSVANADALLVMTKFVDHRVEHAAKANGTPIVRCLGGMTALKDKLTELYVGEGVTQ